MKTSIFIGLILFLVIGAGVYLYSQGVFSNLAMQQEEQQPTEDDSMMEHEQQPELATTTVIGKSVDGNEITAYHFGTGDTELLFVGGIHGGYSANTALVAFDLMDYLTANPDVIPANERITVVPVLNPDGLKKVVGTTGRFDPAGIPSNTVPGRFNGDGVDLNRNFDCDWQSTGTWQSTTVDGGTAPFSEPESMAIKSYIDSHKITAAVVYYSAGGGVFASNCHTGVLPETNTLTNLYADASGYKAYESFDFYEITGDMVNWLAKDNVPAISVLLTNHKDAEWSKNRAGIDALLQHYASTTTN